MARGRLPRRGEYPAAVAKRIVANAWVYDQVQERVAGLSSLRERVASHVQGFTGSILDVGAGTGNFADLFPPSSRYVGVDPDPVKISRLQQKFPDLEAQVADGTSLPFEAKSFDYAVCIDVSHHLTAGQLEQLFAELARVVRTELLFVDALWMPRSIVSRALWSIDRGRHPRQESTLLAALREKFDANLVEEFRLTHSYLLVRATPRPK